ncbi:uncharacterized protein TNCV_148091 [Trichonephila clavipes]|nr:uncharacterized protein TNCV_148091 [Trichonephila clavipes]
MLSELSVELNFKGKKTQRKARIILDKGSQRSYIKKSTAEELGFEIQREEEFSHALVGGRKTEIQRHNCYKIYLYTLDGEYSCSLDALDQDIICNDIAKVGYGPWMRELKRKKIFITDFQNSLEPIEVLLGANVVDKLFTGKQEQLTSELVAMVTKLGWTLMGKVPQLQHQNVNMTVVSMLSRNSYGDRFNSCQVIYSQFGLAIHQNDHQARHRFVEWAENEIAVVPDFHKRILFSDEAHFWLNGYVNKQNCRIWSEANPQVYVETPLHPEKLTVWCALWAGGILLQKR